MFIQANTGGRLHAATEPSISPLSRGFLYGDAIYEVWRTYGGVIFAWEEHWRRLQASAAALYLEIPWSAEEIRGQIARTVQAHRAASGHAGEAYIRLQVSRGAGPIGLDPALADRADFVLLVQPCPELPAAKREQGLVLSVAQGIRRNPAEALNPAWKTGNYLNNLLGLREARSRGADEVVFLNLAGEITEAAVSNLAFADGDRLVLPPLSAGMLAGVTRGLVLRSVAPAAGIAVDERPVRPADLASLSEGMVLGTTRDVVPVRAIDDWRFRVGADTVAARLRAAFGEYSRRYTREHPEYRVF